MAELRERDVLAILELIGEAHDADDLAQFRRVVIPTIRRAVPADYASYNEVGPRGEPLATVTDPELPAEAHAAWGRYALQNPLIVRMNRTRDGRAYRWSDVVTPAELRRLPIYRELYRPMGCEHQIAFALPSPPTLTIGIALGRIHQDFDDRERRLLDLARPHLIQAYRNAELRERTTLVLDALERGLDDRAEAIAVLDGSRHVVFATAAARAVMGGDGKLPAPVADWLDGDDPAREPLVFGSTVALLLRGAARGGDVVVFERGGSTVSVTALRGLGLTPREAQVLQGLVRGRSTSELATELGVSPRTVHKHCEHVYSKLGARDRGQAVATAVAALHARTD